MSTADLTQEDIKKILNSGNPEEISRLLQDVQDAARKTYVPLGWNPSTTASYYKEKYAKKYLPYLNQLLLGDKTEDVLISSVALNISKGTLRQQIDQAWKYIIDRHDPEGKFKLLRTQIELQKDKGGIRLVWVNALPPGAVQKVPPKAKQLKWKTDLEDWVRIARDGDVLELRGRNLDEEDLDFIVNSFAGVKDEGGKPIFHVLKCKPQWVKIAKIRL